MRLMFFTIFLETLYKKFFLSSTRVVKISIFTIKTFVCVFALFLSPKLLQFFKDDLVICYVVTVLFLKEQKNKLNNKHD